MRRWFALSAAGVATLALAAGTVGAASPAQQTPETTASAESALVTEYCLRCHNDRARTGDLSLEGLDLANVGEHTEIWEKAFRKVRGRAMPPAGMPRPDDAGYERLVSRLETELDRAAAAKPDPGRTDTFRRLNRTEYRNAIRDLLALDVDVTVLLPRDDASYGFDNVSVAGLSPTLMERYLSSAQKVSRLAVGSPLPAPGSTVFLIPADRTQEQHVDGLPFGTRGGTVVTHTFPQDGEYEIKILLARNRNENVEGLTEPHEMEVTLDGRRLELFTITPNRNRLGAYYADEDVDQHLELRLPVTAGPHEVGAAFLQRNSALIETTRQPYDAHFNMDRHPRIQPAVRSVSVAGPYDPTGVSDTPSRDRIFVCRPATAADEAPCAREIIATLARRAYRRPVTAADIEAPFAFYEFSREEDGSFEAGIETALRALLASPEFLFRVERDPDGLASGTPYRIADLELASRLSYFLWSSLPDDELLGLAERGELSEPGVVASQVRRMLADPRAGALTTNFAGQWLYLRNLDAVEPNLRLYPDFDDNLRQGFRRETEMLFSSIVDEDRSVLDLIDADYTFINERLARHYEIPNVYGDHFRRVALGDDSRRRGVLGHGSILTVTSHATRTSPVRRGTWVLENMLGMPPPPPPPDVPELGENEPGQQPKTMRELMAQHRASPACAACHRTIDPLGLALENFDAIGRWRDRGEGWNPIDTRGSLPGGAEFTGVAGLRDALLAEPEIFVGTMTEKLLTYALGRGVDHHDAPAVRAIVRAAAAEDYRFSALVVALADSMPFTMRRTE